MSVIQGSLDGLFHGQSFGPREGFIPLDWQTRLSAKFKDSLEAWLDRPADNGDTKQYIFNFFAATATGKTKGSAMIASLLFNKGNVGQMFYCCPNESILEKTRDDYRRYFGIDLVRFSWRKHSDGIPRGIHGSLITYQHLYKLCEATGGEKRRALFPRIFGNSGLVIFDEIHHLIESEAWGRSAIVAFERMPYVVGMTGTPYNSKSGRFAFCTYKETPETLTSGLSRLQADFNYSLGAAVAEGIVKEPHFVFSGRGEDELCGQEILRVRIPVDGVPEGRVVTFDDVLNEEDSSRRLSGAVIHGSVCRKTFLKNALALCEEEGRRSAIFLGGDTSASVLATDDAEQYLPAELAELGYTDDDIEIIVNKNEKSSKEIRRKIASFGTSRKRILIAINMLSEGVDIPEISAAIFLTSVTAKQTTIQRIGRALRLMDPHQTALIFMFADPNLLAIAMEIKAEIKAEARLRRERGLEVKSTGEERRPRAKAIGISGGELALSILNGDPRLMLAVRDAQRRLAAKGVTPNLMNAALKLFIEDTLCQPSR